MPESMFENHQQRVSEIVHSLEDANREDLEAVTHILSRITHLPSEQIKPGLHTLVESLVELQEASAPAIAAPEEWVQRFTAWVESHRGRPFPPLSDDAISRESMYRDDR